ncbi:MAG: discoidin domain-containing protein, partial [Verrucomicrobiia bacterium]
MNRSQIVSVFIWTVAYCAGLPALAVAAAPPSTTPQNTLNLAAAARGAKVTASSEVGRLRGKDHTARAAIDGKIGEGYWCSAFNSKPPHWLEVNLGGPRRFDGVVLHAYELSRINSCRVEQWDGKGWAFVKEFSSTPRPAGDFVPAWEFSDAAAGVARCRFPAVTSDRVRFWFGKDSSVRLYEVEVLEARDEVAGASSTPP